MTNLDTVSVKLLHYATVVEPLADLHYFSRPDEDDYSNENRIITFLNREYDDRVVKKLVDPLEKMSHPPLDAYCQRFVYEFKFTGTRHPNFYDFTKRTASKGAFVDRFKLEHMELACGRLLCRRFDPSAHFEEGYYMYVDVFRNVYALSATEIREKVRSLDLVEGWGGSNRCGWMINTYEWNRLGVC